MWHNNKGRRTRLTARPAGQSYVFGCLLEALVCCALTGKQLAAFFRKETTHRETTYHEFYSEMVALTLTALPLGGSLLVRSLVDHGPLLWLAAIGAPPSTISAFGIVFTLGMIALVPSGVLLGVVVPRIIQNATSNTNHSIRQGLALGISIALATAILMSSMLIVLPSMLGWATFVNLSVILAGSGMVAAKAGASLLGN